MIEIEKPRLDTEQISEDGSFGRFVVSPLERGYGTTLGNSLRRILLSSLPGYAATSVKIAGVQHEFSTVEHVKEDVTEIILNIKELIVRLHCDEDKLVTIEAEGPCEVKRATPSASPDVEMPQSPSCTRHPVGEGGSLNMQLTLSHGRGYVSAEQNQARAAPRDWPDSH